MYLELSAAEVEIVEFVWAELKFQARLIYLIFRIPLYLEQRVHLWGVRPQEVLVVLVLQVGDRPPALKPTPCKLLYTSFNLFGANMKKSAIWLLSVLPSSNCRLNSASRI